MSIKDSGARKMLSPYPDDEWDTGYCKSCGYQKFVIPVEEKVEPIEKDAVLYLCDRGACPNCCYPTCKYTTDISHAVNFKHDLGEAYWEEEKPSEKLECVVK